MEKFSLFPNLKEKKEKDDKTRFTADEMMFMRRMAKYTRMDYNMIRH
jgi:hypothetical protein